MQHSCNRILRSPTPSGRETAESLARRTCGRRPAGGAVLSALSGVAWAAILGLGACAAPGGTRYVYLETEAYRCGAAEGLGCGLELQPVLSGIDELDGVVASGVSWDGLRLRIEIAPGADRDRVLAEARALLADEACCEIPARGAAAPGEPDRWYGADETIQLSRHEASMIAADFAAEIAAAVRLEPEVAERLHALLRGELERAFEQAHAAGGRVERLWEQLPESTKRIEARLAELLPAEQRARVMAVIARELDG